MKQKHKLQMEQKEEEKNLKFNKGNNIKKKNK